VQQIEQYKRHRPETTLLYQLIEWYYHDFKVLVNYWWRQVGDHVGAPNASLHAIFSIKALSKAQRDSWREIFAHYIFSDT
jgi:hypothetical protein